ncbi:MAG: hypothetical protein KJ007_05975 [Burkholderiales bacterium]|nr:hypothetical protein [Burkholderiales bacterium]
MPPEDSFTSCSYRQRIEAILPASGATHIRRDPDGDFVFRRDEMTLLLALDEQDPGFIRVILPRFHTAESDAARLRLLEASSRTCAAVKLAKLFFVGDDLFAVVEAVAPTPASVDAAFIQRLVSSAIASAVYVIRTANGHEPELLRQSTVAFQ